MAGNLIKAAANFSRASSREVSRRPLKRRTRQQDPSYEESIGLEKTNASMKLNKMEETTCGLSNDYKEDNDSPILLTKAVVVINHLVCYNALQATVPNRQ